MRILFRELTGRQLHVWWATSVISRRDGLSGLCPAANKRPARRLSQTCETCLRKRWQRTGKQPTEGNFFAGLCGSVNYCACLVVHGRPLVTLVVQGKAPASLSDKDGIMRAAKLMRLMLHDLRATLEANRASCELASMREGIRPAGPVAAGPRHKMSQYMAVVSMKLAKSPASTHSGQIAQRMRDYIQEHYVRPIQLNDLAVALKMNASYLSCLFSQATGVTFHHYLEELRLARARDLLSDPTLRVREIAFAVGYSNPNHFRNVFKTHFGVSPSAWRENASPPAAKPV